MTQVTHRTGIGDMPDSSYPHPTSGLPYIPVPHILVPTHLYPQTCSHNYTAAYKNTHTQTGFGALKAEQDTAEGLTAEPSPQFLFHVACLDPMQRYRSSGVPCSPCFPSHQAPMRRKIRTQMSTVGGTWEESVSLSSGARRWQREISRATKGSKS